MRHPTLHVILTIIGRESVISSPGPLSAMAFYNETQALLIACTWMPDVDRR